MRIVLKISGESLKGDQNISNNSLEKVLREIKEIKKENELIIVVGGGNFWRGRNQLDIDDSTSDYIGMLATDMNALAISSYLSKNNINNRCYSAFEVCGVIEKPPTKNIIEQLKDNVVILGGGTGLPGFSTDMTTINAAVTYNADLILMSKNIDGIYEKDPREEGAKKIDQMTHEELFNMSLKQGTNSLLVMDLEAMSALVKHKIPIYLYSNNRINTIDDVINGKEGTKVIS